MDPANEVQTAIRDIIERRQEVVRLAARQRSKFENWLKFELAVALPHRGFANVRIEDQYPQGLTRCDLAFETGGVKYYLELKTSNVNWRAEGLENRTRPITKNITKIVEDILKLRKHCTPPDRGLAGFVLFPVPLQVWSHQRAKLEKHLERIRQEGGVALDVSAMNFAGLSENFGAVLFVVQVT
jgi:hypothetical protein